MKYLFEAKLDSVLKPDNQVWAEIARAGEWKGYEAINPETGQPEKVKVVISEENLNQMISNFENEEITNKKRVDIHLSHPGSPDYSPGAVGWITKLEKREGKLFGLLNFLEEFASEIRKGKWMGFSIEALSNAIHPVSGKSIGAYLTGLGVTNRPFIRGMEFPGLESQIIGNQASAFIYLSRNEQEESISMSDKQTEKTVEEVKAAEMPEVEVEVEKPACSVCAALREKLGLAPEATDEEVLAKVEEMVGAKTEDKKEEAPAEEVQASEIQASQLASRLAFETQISTLSIQLSQVQAQAQEMKSKLDKYEESEIEAVIATGIKEGRILAGQREDFVKLAKLDKGLFNSLAVNASKKVQLGQLIPNGLASTSVKSEAESYAEEIIAKARKK